MILNKKREKSRYIYKNFLLSQHMIRTNYPGRQSRKRTKLVKRRTKPVKWNDDRCRQAFTFALLYGATDEQIALSMDVSIKTIEYWKLTKPEFMEALQAGKDQADARVAEAFYKRAIGYSHPDVHILSNRVKIFDEEGKVIEERTEPLIVPITKHYPPDTFAGHKWLTIRQRAIWAEVNKAIPPPVNLTQINFNMFTKQEKLVLEKIGMGQLLIGQANTNND